MTVYELVSENMTAVGGPMGSEHTWDSWRKLFSTLKAAKAHAKRDYLKEAQEPLVFEWHKTSKNEWCTGDLRFVMYTIRRKAVTP